MSESLGLMHDEAMKWLTRELGAEDCWALYIDGTNFNIQRRGSTEKEPSLVVLASAVQRRQGVVLPHATGSKLPQVKDQILEAISHGMHVVSTCEELARARLRSGKLPQLEHRRRPIAVIDDGAHA